MMVVGGQEEGEEEDGEIGGWPEDAMCSALLEM